MRSSSRAGRRAGFTLLETLAAVVMMLLFYGILSAQGLTGFELEGDAERRFEASLVADRQLADLETAIAEGLLPALGTSEDRDGDFDVRIEVAPFELPWGAPAADEGGRAQDEPPSLLSVPTSRDAAPILSIHVIVAWNDGRPRAVERATFALDPAAIAATLERAGVLGATDAEGNPVFGGGAGNPAGSGEGDDR